MKPAGERTHHITVFLCDIRSAQNAGAIMRTADAVGAEEVVLGGYTPGPYDRFGRENKAFTKASLGSEKSVVYRHEPEFLEGIQALKKKGVFVIALEQGVKAQDYKKVVIPQGNIVVLLGNEVSGLSQEAVALADVLAEIPMRGKKESLNVSVSAGIALYRWFDK